MEAPAQPPDPGEPAGHQQHPGELRSAAAGRAGPHDRRGHVGQMTAWRIAGLAWLLLAGVPAAAQPAAEPDGYRTEDYRAPTPATLTGARVLTTAEAAALWHARGAVFVD